jgi:hypothetical protein
MGQLGIRARVAALAMLCAVAYSFGCMAESGGAEAAPAPPLKCSAATPFFITPNHSQLPFAVPEFAVGPPFQELKDVKPGSVITVCFFVQNRLAEPIDVRLKARDAEGSHDPQALIEVVDHSKYGASQWMQFPQPTFHLNVGERADEAVTIRVPVDVGGGSWYSAITAVTLVKSASANGGGVLLEKEAGINSLILMDMSGPARLGGMISEVDSPSYATHGPRNFIPFHAVWDNTGNVTDAVSGRLTVESIFGNSAFTAKFSPAELVARDGSREFDTSWDNTPWIGLFHPRIELVGRDGKKHVRSFPWILILPPWYYILAVVVAILFPIWRWWSNRRKWNRLVAALSGDGDDEWDDDDEYWDDDEAWDEHG